MIWEEEVINTPPRSPTPAARTVSFLMDHQLEPVIRTLQTARLRDQEPMFWSMQGSISADSFGCYRLELARVLRSGPNSSRDQGEQRKVAKCKVKFSQMGQTGQRQIGG